MPDETCAAPYDWLKCGKEAVDAAMKALDEIVKRMDELNPLQDMEEMAYLRKARDAFQKAIREIAFIKNMQN